MTQTRSLVLCICFSLFNFLISETLYAQNELHFSYKCENEIIRPVKVKVSLKSPDREIYNLLTDSLSEYEFSEKNYFKSKGKYVLSIRFESSKYGKDSLIYDFELNGEEISTSISISFDYRDKLVKEKNIYVKGRKVLNGYIRLNKYYYAPNTVEIQLDTLSIGTEYYKGPFFTIKNNSKDTLYGEHLPGYFWGVLSYIKNDSIVATRIGILDYNFVESEPLYPDSTKIATVGSFGLSNKLLPFEYRFEVLFAKIFQGFGNKIEIYKEQPNFDWWAGTKEYYKLIYNFEVKR